MRDWQGYVKMVSGSDMANGFEPHKLKGSTQHEIPEFIAPNCSQINGMYISGWLGIMKGLLIYRNTHRGIIFRLALDVGNHEIIIC